MRSQAELSKLDFAPSIIFDVGANRGSTVAHTKEIFPNAVIHAFEPDSGTFSGLYDRFKEDKSVVLNQMALNNVRGKVLMRAAPGSFINRIIKKAPEKIPSEHVEGETGDHYCRERAIDHIDFLKIDAEGADMKVLQGFENMLDAKKIDFVQVECGTDPSNRVHVELQRFMAFMFKKGYGLYDLYDVRRDPKLKHERIKNAWCCNALFKVSRPVEVADHEAEELEEQDA